MLYFKAYLSVKTIAVRGKHAKIRIVFQATSDCFSSRGTTATDKKHKALDIRADGLASNVIFQSRPCRRLRLCRYTRCNSMQ